MPLIYMMYGCYPMRGDTVVFCGMPRRAATSSTRLLLHPKKPLATTHRTVIDPDAYRGDMVDALFNTVRKHMRSINVITNSMAMVGLHEQAAPGAAGAAALFLQPQQNDCHAGGGVVCDDPMAYYDELGVSMMMGDLRAQAAAAAAAEEAYCEAQDLDLEDDTDVCYLQNMASTAAAAEPGVTGKRRMLNLNVFGV